jgi:cytochrome c peroxidase
MKRILVAVAAAAYAAAAGADAQLREEANRLFGQIAAAPAQPSPEAELGRALFWDVRLSADGKTACGSCHLAKDWAADRRRFSVDARGKHTGRHSQTVFNAMSQPMLRWTGDRPDGASQAQGSITGSLGFASREAAVEKMKELGYQERFRVVYPQEPNPLTAANYGRALQAYQATLTTPGAFDRFLAGDDKALGDRQRRGLRAFIDTGCAVCHNGPNLGGASLQRFGLLKEYWAETRSEKVDLGKYGASKKEEDKYVFRVPMLRNITRTAPYFHDGSVDELDRAIRIMAAVQLGKTLADDTVAAIAAFLDSLTGEVPPNYAPPGEKPQL